MSKLAYLDGNLLILTIFCAMISLMCLMEALTERRAASRHRRQQKRIAALQWETKRTDRENEQRSFGLVEASFRHSSPQLIHMSQLRSQHIAAQHQYGMNLPEQES